MNFLNSDSEVAKVGKSEFFDRAVKYYSSQREKKNIANNYRDGYGSKDIRKELGNKVREWEDEQAWPAL